MYKVRLRHLSDFFDIGENPHELSDTARTSLLYCMAVVVTTIHAEDFKDIVGFRPGREGGMRIGREGSVVHAYGAGLLGWVGAFGMACEVVRLAQRTSRI